MAGHALGGTAVGMACARMSLGSSCQGWTGLAVELGSLLVGAGKDQVAGVRRSSGLEMVGGRNGMSTGRRSRAWGSQTTGAGSGRRARSLGLGRRAETGQVECGGEEAACNVSWIVMGAPA
jgi:hypothetical protein